ncbi:glycosyl transferase [Planobispora rosea]|uniref:Glycosyl transferase n=1 Tax=Planobispora rosea TaxID=35762 RepID=A0A8J3S1N7_PLARO|nr:glycosyltransferase family 4 protein [Planobispora rosea]GGS83107.1 glycosyl transferase [Planobispora rosea]GIH84162.1 glycosyl transferase [Planobispora rosea]
MLLESVSALLSAAKVTVFLPEEGPLCARLRERGAEVRLLPTLVLRRSLLSPRGLFELIAQVIRTLPGTVSLLRRIRPAALYVNTVTLPLWLVAGRLTGVRVICHVHEAEEGIPPLLRRLLILPVRLAHRVIANSGTCRRTLLEGGVRPGRISVVHNGVPGPDAATPGRAAPAGRLLLTGRLSPRKGSDVAIRAVHELRNRGRDVSLTLVGAVFPGYEWFEEELRALAGEDGAITFAGFQDEVWPRFAEADIVLVPSLGESFGNVAVEGMLAGRPVIASSVQGLAEIMSEEGVGTLVRPSDPAALAEAVEALLDDWPRALEMAERGRVSAQKRFGLDRYRQEICQAVFR